MQNRPPPDFRWDDARILRALLDTRTLSGAAARIGVNTSTIWSPARRARRGLGSTVVRSHARRSYADRARRAPRSARRSRRTHATGLLLEAAGRETKAEGVVRITAPPGVAENMLAPALPRLLARHPELRVVIDASIGYADLTRREAGGKAYRPGAGTEGRAMPLIFQVLLVDRRRRNARVAGCR